MTELTDLVIAVVAIVSVTTIGQTAFFNWRIERLENCIDNQQKRLDTHLEDEAR